MKIAYRERKEILTVQHQDNLVILEMLRLGSPIRFLYKDEALMRECHFLNHRQKVGKFLVTLHFSHAFKSIADNH